MRVSRILSHIDNRVSCIYNWTVVGYIMKYLSVICSNSDVAYKGNFRDGPSDIIDSTLSLVTERINAAGNALRPNPVSVGTFTCIA